MTTAPSAVDWLAEYVADGEVAFRIGREGDRVIAEWINIVRLSARRDGTDVQWTPHPDALPIDLAKIKRGSAKLLLRHLENRLALHGAAVALGDRAVALLGRSGQGKSTLAALVCEHAGASLLSDDAIGLVTFAGSPTGWALEPFEIEHWLDDAAWRALGRDAPSGKSPMAAARVSDRVTPITGFVELVFSDGPPRLVRLNGIDALAVLIPQFVRFILDDPKRQREELETLARILTTVPVFRLERPRDLERARESVSRIEALLLARESIGG